MEQLHQYAEKVISGVKPIIGAILATLSYIIFPEKAFVTAAFAVGGAILLDIVTKYIALSSSNHGFKNAVRLKKIYSRTLWEGTRIKLVSYLIIAILVGLSYRVTMLTQVSVFLATVVYSVVFLREAQSILENLCDAGADLNWLLLWTRKKEKQILENDNIGQITEEELVEKVDDYEQRI